MSSSEDKSCSESNNDLLEISDTNILSSGSLTTNETYMINNEHVEILDENNPSEASAIEKLAYHN